jgi:hypothetical protein
MQYFVQLIQEVGPDGYNAILVFLKKRLTFWAFCFPKIVDPVAIDPTEIALKLPNQWGSGSIRTKAIMICGVNLSGYNIKQA